MMRKSFYTAALACTAMALTVNQAMAVDANVTGLASFRLALSLNAAAALDFAPGADIEFTGTAAGTDTVTVSTSGARTSAGAFFSFSDNTATAGLVEITGTAAEVVDIACDQTSLIQDGGTNQLEINAIEISTAASGVAAGAGTACTGVTNNVATLTLAGTSADHVLVGGTIIATSEDGVLAGDYSTANATDPIVVRVVYQ